MKAFEKIEIILNSLIIGAGKLLSKIVPPPLKRKLSIINEKIKSLITALLAKLAKLLEIFFVIIKYIPSKIQELIGQLIDFITKQIKRLKSSTISPETIKKIFAPILSILAALSLRIKTWYLALKPTTVAIGIVTTATVGIAILNIITSGTSIYDKTKEEKVIVKLEPKNLRALYYKQSEKHLLVNGVTVPIYVGTGNAPRTLILDFTMLMSNRYLKSYFFEKDYLLKDRLNTHFEPVVPTLPLEKEGKRIIKEKIIDETNALIKLLKIDGKVEDVYFHTIING